MRRDQGMSLCLTVTFPAGSKKDLLLPKAEPLKNTDGATVITYLRRGKKRCAAAVTERGVRKM